MERIHLTNYRLNHLMKYKLTDNVISTEATIYYYPHKTKWENEMKVLKLFKRDLDEDRIKNIEFLNDNKEDLNSIPSLVVPEAMVSYYGVDKGIIMPFIKNANLADLLKFKGLKESAKIEYLKGVGETLHELSLLRKYNSRFKNFALNDLHEGNIIIDSETGEIRIIDLDSAYTGNGISTSKYLTVNENLDIYCYNLSNKYPVNEDYTFIPNEQTDLYCYHMMILNYLYGGKVENLSQDEFYYYLEYLSKLGVNDDFLESCLRLYINQENINPKDFLDGLDEMVPYANKEIYDAIKRK